MPLSYQWKADGVPIPGETSNSYAITAADANKVISCEVTGTNPMGSVSVNSSNPVTIPLPSPVNTVAPVVTGTAIENMVLTVSNNGTWNGAPTITYTYQWRRNGANIPGEVNNTYTLTSLDVGRTIDCVVRGANIYGWDEQDSNDIGPVVSAIIPANVAPPNIMGVAIDGQVLTVTSNGTWTGYPPLTYTYQWRRNGSNIGGATSSTYTLVSADIGANIDCMVTATNVYGSASSDSNDIGPIAGVAPSNISAPIVSGTNSVGNVLTTTNGVWAGSTPITYTYQWRRGGSPIGGATASTYTLVQADAAATIDCVVTATNPYGSTPATSSNSLYIYDTDANAFISAASITDNTQKAAVNKLVADLKGYSIWNKFKAIYPIVGGTAAAHKWNLKDPQDTDAAFRLTFTSGWTHSANGMIPVNAYADTFLNANSILTLNSSHLSYYSRTNSNGTEVEIGTQNTGTAQFIIEIRTAGISYYVVHQQAPYATSSDANSLGFYVANRTASNIVNGWKNGIKVATSTSPSTTKANLKVYIGAQNNSGTAGLYTTKECAFASIGDGLSDTEAANFYTAVQAYQTTLGRNV